MCGRFTLTADPAELQAAFPEFTLPAQMSPRFNIAPSQPVAVIPNDGRNTVDFFAWGLIPSWAKEISIGSKLINARAETLAEKPSFRAAYRRRRCLILADGFYEWRAPSGGSKQPKTPYFIHLEGRAPFGMAGLWEIWQAPDGSEIRSCTIITTEPNALMANIHNRMPVILPRTAWQAWLTPAEQRPEVLAPLLRPYPAEQMRAYTVSRQVNSPTYDAADCLSPV